MNLSEITKYTKWYIIEALKIGIIMLLITIGWQQLELYMLGKIQPSEVDTIIALILTGSIYLHVGKSYKK